MFFRILIGSPMYVPASVDEDRFVLYIHILEFIRINRSVGSPRLSDDDTVEIGNPLKREFRQIFAPCKTMERRVNIGAGVGNHFNFPDVELGPRCIAWPRFCPRQMLRNDWRGKTLIRDHPMFNSVAHINEGWHGNLSFEFNLNQCALLHR